MAYNTVSDIPLISTKNTGPTPTIPDDTLEPQTNIFLYKHTKEEKTWNEYTTTNNALKQLLLGWVEGIFIRTLCECIFRYASLTTTKIVYHLNHNSSAISPSILIDNNTRMKMPYDVSLPIHTIWDQIQNDRDM